MFRSQLEIEGVGGVFFAFAISMSRMVEHSETEELSELHLADAKHLFPSLHVYSIAVLLRRKFIWTYENWYHGCKVSILLPDPDS